MVGTGISLPESFFLTCYSQGRDSPLWAATVLLSALKSRAQATDRCVKSGHKTKYNREEAHGEVYLGTGITVLFTQQPL